MKLVLLGTSGYHPNERRHTACLFLPESGVVLDAGTGIFRLREYLQSDRLDIFLTHAHLDHVIGLTYLQGILPQDMLPRITVHAEEEKLAAIRDHLFTELLFPVAPVFILAKLTEKEKLADGAVVRHFPLEHPGGSIGYRIDWPDRSMAYVTDTNGSPDARYVEHIKEVDLLIHEAYFTREDPHILELTGHSSTAAAAAVAAQARVGRAVLVHIGPQTSDTPRPDLAAARRIFPNLEIGADRMEIEF